MSNPTNSFITSHSKNNTWCVNLFKRYRGMLFCAICCESYSRKPHSCESLFAVETAVLSHFIRSDVFETIIYFYSFSTFQ
jgi:hypothetical protein